MTNSLKLIKPQTPSEKKTRTVVDTILVTPKLLDTWHSPPFQRPVRENDKVLALAEELKKNGGVLPGIITLGVFNGVIYIIDGQHRIKAFRISGIDEGYSDIRTHYCESMADMGEEFVKLNSQLVRMRPDDILRGLESSVDALQRIREKCPFVGYDYIRRNGTNAPVVSMSLVVRSWRGSSNEVPSPNAAGMSAATLAMTMDEVECGHLIDFLGLAYAAFGRDIEYGRLWGGLNLMICMWLYRRVVMTQHSPKTPRLSKELFKKCLLSLSASGDYLDWLVGRVIGERDRSPAYGKVKAAFVSRLFAETGDKVSLPQPTWHHK